LASKVSICNFEFFYDGMEFFSLFVSRDPNQLELLRVFA